MSETAVRNSSVLPATAIKEDVMKVDAAKIELAREN
jgi:hypothetical protein